MPSGSSPVEARALTALGVASFRRRGIRGTVRLLRRQSYSVQEVPETRVRAHWVKHGLHFHPNQPPLAMGMGFFKGGKCLVALPQPSMDDCDIGPSNTQPI